MESSLFGSRTTMKSYQVVTRILITPPVKKLTLGLIKVAVVRVPNHNDSHKDFCPTAILKFFKNWEIWVPPPTALRIVVGRHLNHSDLVGVSDDQSRCGWDQPDVFPLTSFCWIDGLRVHEISCVGYHLLAGTAT